MTNEKLGFKELQRIFGSKIVKDTGDGYYAVLCAGRSLPFVDDVLSAAVDSTNFQTRIVAEFTGFARELGIFLVDNDDTAHRKISDDDDEKSQNVIIYFKENDIETPNVITKLKRYPVGHLSDVTAHEPVVSEIRSVAALTTGHGKEERECQHILKRLTEVTGVAWTVQDVKGQPHFQTQHPVPKVYGATYALCMDSVLGIEHNIPEMPSQEPGVVSIPLGDITIENIGKLRGKELLLQKSFGVPTQSPRL